MLLSLSTALALTTVASGAFTAYTGFKLYSIRSKGNGAVKTLLSLGGTIHKNFNGFYKFNANLKNADGIFLAEFKAGGQNIEYYTQSFSYKKLQTTIVSCLRSKNLLLLRLKILQTFDTISKLSEEGDFLDFTGGNLCIKIIISKSPKSNELLEQVDLIESMANIDYSTVALAGLATTTSAAGYINSNNDDSDA
jgi:hypothetical protein